MKTTKIIALILALALAVCAFAACGTEKQGYDEVVTEPPAEPVETESSDDTDAKDLDAIYAAALDELGKSTLIMGTNAEFEPFEYRENDEIVGYDVDMVSEAALLMDMDVQVEDMNFDSLITALTSGKIDIIAAGMSVTDERLEVVNFSDPYYSATQVIIVPKEGATVSSSADLAGKKIGVQEATTGDIYVDENIEGAEINRFKKAVDASVDLANGRLDAVVLDEQPAKRIVEQNDALTILDEPLTQEEYAIAVRKDNPKLLEAINAALSVLEDIGTKDVILDKYGLNVADAE